MSGATVDAPRLDDSGPVHKVVVHRFTVGDVEDPDLWAAEALYKWEHSDAGQWVMQNALETPEWHRHFDVSRYGHEYAIVAKLSDKALIYYRLRWT